MSVVRPVIAPVQKLKPMVGLDLVLMTAAVAGYFIVAFREVLLPARFSYDGIRIQAIAMGTQSAFDDPSYGVVADVYRAVGLAEHPLLAGVIGYSLALLAVVNLRWRLRGVSPRPGVYVLLVFSVLFSSIYLGFYSKDVFVLGIVFLVLNLRRGVVAEGVLLLAMCVYASEVRSYWFLVAGLYVGYRVAQRFKMNLAWVIVVSCAALVVLALGVKFGLHVDPDYFRTTVNAVRGTSDDASSAIRPIIPSAGLSGQLLNIVLTWFALMVPIPLLALGGVYTLSLTVLFVVIWLLFWGAARSNFRGQSASIRSTSARTTALVLGFSCTQALFEPDYGSVLRHLTPLLILISYLVWETAAVRAEEAAHRG